jgi:hypothetical protein
MSLRYFVPLTQSASWDATVGALDASTFAGFVEQTVTPVEEI